MPTQIAGSAKVVLTVSHQRETLRHVSRFLHVFGYRVVEAADATQAMAAIESAVPEMMIVDWAMPDACARDLCHAIRRNATSEDCFVFMLTDRYNHGDLLAALEAGVDDFLRMPLVYGELLARLRAGGRTLTKRRRERTHRSVDRLTGIPTRAALESWLNDRLVSMDAPDYLAVATFDFDSFQRINRRFGREVGDDLLRAAATKLESLEEETLFVARVGGDRFTAVLAVESDAGLESSVQRIRTALAGVQLEARSEVGSLTVSAGYGRVSPPDLSPTDVIAASEEALSSAKQSGRDCSVAAGAYDEETQQWRELAVRGNLFKRTVARDVMTPCALILSSDTNVHDAHQQLSRVGLPMAPVVDDACRLVGILTDAVSAAGVEHGSTAPVGDLIDTKEIACFQEESSFRELFDYFVDGSGDAVAVLHDGSPVGLVSREDLAALIEPMSAPTETRDRSESDTSVAVGAAN